MNLKENGGKKEVEVDSVLYVLFFSLQNIALYNYFQGESESQEAKALNLKNVGGVFWVSVGGIALAVLLVFVEMLLHVAKESIKSRTTFKKELQEEIKFYFKFKGMIKPVRNRKSKSKFTEEKEKYQENGLEYNLVQENFK